MILSEIEEFDDPPVETLAERLAVAKVQAVAERNPSACVVGADTVVVADGNVLGKPVDHDDARHMLRKLAGHWHVVRTGVAVAIGGRLSAATSTSRVLVHRFTDSEITAYVDSGRPMDKAGAYGIQDADVPTVDAIDGCFCGVMGLPLWLTARLLSECGVSPASPPMERCLTCPER